MKKAIMLLLVILLFTSTVLCISSCANGNTDKNDASEGENLSVARDRLKISSYSQTPALKYACSDNETCVYVFYLGQVYNVPISYGAAHYYDGASDIEITYTNTYLTEDSVTSSKSSCISNTVSYTSEETIVKEEGGGAEITVNVLDMVNVSGRYNVKTTNGNKTSVGSGQSYSYSDIYELSRTYTTSKSETIKYVLGEKNEPNYYYRLTLFAQCDVYAFVAYDSEKDTVAVSFDLSANQNSLYYAIDKSDDSTFPASNAYQDKLVFDTSILENSDLFEYKWNYTVNYEPMGGTMTGALRDTYTPDGIVFPTPSREYYTFGGWYYDTSFAAKATESELTENPADVTLYAKWEPATWTLTFDEDFEMRKGRDHLGRGGKIWQLDKEYLEQYQNDGYLMQITLHYEVVRYGGDYVTGIAYIAVAMQDSNGIVDVSAGGIEGALKSESFEVSDSHKIYEGTITATTAPETFYVKQICMLFDCNNDDVLGGVLPTADDFYTVTKDSYIEITFIKADT